MIKKFKEWLHKKLDQFMVHTYKNSYDLTTGDEFIALVNHNKVKLHYPLFLLELNKHHSRFIYESDRWFGLKNIIQNPLTAAVKMHGDCDDYASAMIKLLYGYECYLLTYFATNPFKAHTVAVLKGDDGKLRLIDYDMVLATAGSIDDLLTEVSRYRKVKIISVHYALFDWEDYKYKPVYNIKERLEGGNNE